MAWRCNVSGRRLVVQQPPTAQNYAIGCSGNVTGTGPFNQPAGFIEGVNAGGLTPPSLYRAQLAERLGRSGPPRITSAPRARRAAANAVVSFRVEVQGVGPFTYQWLYAGQPIDGATGPVLVLAAATPAHAGFYSVAISNTEGTFVSDPVELIFESAGAARLVNLSSRGNETNETALAEIYAVTR